MISDRERRKYPGFIVAHGAGTNRKIRRLSDAEVRCFLLGVLDLAGQSPTRGWLLIAEGQRATYADIAHQAGVTETVARSTMTKLRKLGTVVPAGDEFERLKNWSTWNPGPKPSDQPEATRERKRRSRANAKEKARDDEDSGRSPQLTIGSGGSPLKAAPTRKRQIVEWRNDIAQFAHERYGDHPRAVAAVEQAVTSGNARTPEDVDKWVAQWWPHVAERRVA